MRFVWRCGARLVGGHRFLKAHNNHLESIIIIIINGFGAARCNLRCAHCALCALHALPVNRAIFQIRLRPTALYCTNRSGQHCTLTLRLDCCRLMLLLVLICFFLPLTPTGFVACTPANAAAAIDCHLRATIGPMHLAPADLPPPRSFTLTTCHSYAVRSIAPNRKAICLPW